MENTKNLTILTEETLETLTEAYDMLNILYELADGNRKTEPLIKFVKTRVGCALNNMENAKELISD